MHQFILKTPADVQRAIAFISRLPLMPIIELEIKRYRRDRTVAQNKLMWSWLEVVADHMGTSREHLHELLKSQWLGFDVIEVPALLQGHMGMTRSIGIPKSTTKLTVDQMTEYLQKLEALGLAEGLIMPTRDDYRYAVYGERVK